MKCGIYTYGIQLPVLDGGIFKGMILILPESEENFSGVTLGLGNPSYLYRSDFTIGPISQ